MYGQRIAAEMLDFLDAKVDVEGERREAPVVGASPTPLIVGRQPTASVVRPLPKLCG